MSGAASIRARFEEAKSRAASSNDDQRGGKKTKSNVEHCADEEVLRMLVRDHLSHKSSTQIFMESKGFVKLFKKSQEQTLMVQAMAQWDDAKPEFTEEMRKNRSPPIPHPEGPKRVYTLRLALMTLADLLKEDLTTSAAINSLVTKETSELEHAIRCFKPRYNKPLPDRTWKWEFYLGDLASEEVRDVVRALCNYKGCRDKISFEPMRAMQQPESEKKLWTWIKKQPRGS